jgi:hypothetical protein
MRKRWITALAALGLGGALGAGIATATAGSGQGPQAVATPAAVADLGPKFGVGFAGKMTGAAEVPPGDPDGTGNYIVRLNAAEGLVCFKIVVHGVDLPIVASHIHQAAAGAAGPVVVPFVPLTALPGSTDSAQAKGCVSADPTLIRQIQANPSQFYVNTHNKPFPAGTVRGQLVKLKEKPLVCKTKKGK